MRDIDRKVAWGVEEYGWHVIKVMGDGDAASFAYSVGLFHSFGHPEVVICGLDLDVMHEIVNVVGDAASQGITFSSGQSADTILQDLDVHFRSVDKSYYDSYFGRAQHYYGDESFPVLQIFWPDGSGRFPWQDGFTSELKPLQPSLFV